MHLQTMPSSIRIMACRLFATQPLHKQKPMLPYSELTLRNKIQSLLKQIEYFLYKKIIFEYAIFKMMAVLFRHQYVNYC